jgi:hypothetical protein
MTARQRYVETLTFGTPDRIPLEPGYPRESTRAAWAQQGFPKGQDTLTALFAELGLTPEESTQPWVDLNVTFAMHPRFEEKVLSHEHGHYVVQDWMGAIVEISDQFDVTYLREAKDFVTRKWHKFPVESRADWERMKQRYDPRDPVRFPVDLDARCRQLADRDYLYALRFNGPFWQLREWCGFEGLCLLMAEDPAFVGEMGEFWTEYVSAVMAPVLARVRLDYVGISEDMAYKAHSMISPDMTRRFLLPAYQRWVPEIRASGCPLIDMDSDGYVGDLIPLWIESGINVCWPVEVAAHNDIVGYRQRYGTQMAYHGAIDKRAIAKGGETMRAEVMRVVPPLLAQGGFIPGCDHGVPPDISWPNFVEYSRLLAELTGWL